jgi:predicted lipid-binding transport protein (Tim44 family)
MERTASQPSPGDTAASESMPRPTVPGRLAGLLALGLGAGSFLLALAAYDALPASATATGPVAWVEMFVLLPTLLSVGAVAAASGLALFAR